MNIPPRYREAALWLLWGIGAGTAWATTPEHSEDWSPAADPEEVQAVAAQEPMSSALAHGWHAMGLASWYGRHFHGKKTASGERFDRHALTAAHPRLPLGSWLRVVNPANGHVVHVRVNDRGPRSKRFVIDLSEAAAERLGFRHKGTAHVQMQLSAKPHARERSDAPH